MNPTVLKHIISVLWDVYVPDAQDTFINLVCQSIHGLDSGENPLTANVGLHELDLTRLAPGTRVFITYLKFYPAINNGSIDEVRQCMAELRTLVPHDYEADNIISASLEEVCRMCKAMNK